MTLIEALFNYFKKLYSFLKKPVVKISVLIIVLIFSGFYLADQYNELVNTLADLEVDIWLLVFALFLVVLTVFMGTLTWWSILSWLNFQRDWLLTAKGYAYSALAKYIPGFIWQFAGRAYFSAELSIPIKFIGLGIIIELVLTTIIGGTLAGIAFILSGQEYFSEITILRILIPLITLLLVILLIKLPDLVERIIRKYADDVIEFNKKYLFQGMLFNLMGWLLMSLAYFLIVNSFGVDDFGFISAMFFHTTSFFAGTIALPFPNGLVIREAILVLLGGETLGEHLLVVSSILFRILILIGEAILTVILFVAIQTRKRRDAQRKS